MKEVVLKFNIEYINNQTEMTAVFIYNGVSKTFSHASSNNLCFETTAELFCIALKQLKEPCIVKVETDLYIIYNYLVYLKSKNYSTLGDIKNDLNNLFKIHNISINAPKETKNAYFFKENSTHGIITNTYSSNNRRVKEGDIVTWRNMENNQVISKRIVKATSYEPQFNIGGSERIVYKPVTRLLDDGEISMESPLGKNSLHKKIGKVVTIKVEDVVTRYIILNIE
ncbi:MAG: GreA/GreB family elongation factor [Clostridia bacterium]|nr:GreA/GreB family elongation factor [Clostridia bacterium]